MTVPPKDFTYGISAVWTGSGNEFQGAWASFAVWIALPVQLGLSILLQFVGVICCFIPVAVLIGHTN